MKENNHVNNISMAFFTAPTQSNSELFTVSKTDKEDQLSIDDIANKILNEGFVDEQQTGWIIPVIHSISKQGTTASAGTVTKILTQPEDQVDSGLLNKKAYNVHTMELPLMLGQSQETNLLPRKLMN
jgi:hypothetical protein